MRPGFRFRSFVNARFPDQDWNLLCSSADIRSGSLASIQRPSNQKCQSFGLPDQSVTPTSRIGTGPKIEAPAIKIPSNKNANPIRSIARALLGSVQVCPEVPASSEKATNTRMRIANETAHATGAIRLVYAYAASATRIQKA